MARRVEYKHNQVALLDTNISEAVNFQGIIGFLNRSRLRVALSVDPYVSLVYIQQFWGTVHQDTDIEPHVLRANVNNTEIAISEETIRAALALGGAADDPMSYPGTLIMGCLQRMGYRGKPNDGLVGEWRYFMHVIIQCLSPRKAGTDGLNIALHAAMVALILNKRFNFALYIYRELVMQITPAEGQEFLMYPRFIQLILNHFLPNLPQHPIRLTLTPMSKRIFNDGTKVKQHNATLIHVNTPLFGHLINHDYIEPPNDNWFHPDEIAQVQGPNLQQQQQPQPPIQQPVLVPQQQVDIPVNEPVLEEVVHELEQDLGMNMDDFVDDAVNSPIHEVEGNVVTDDESSSSSSDTILPISEETESDESRDFPSDRYERLASIPLANAGKRIKSTARRQRRKSIRDPPSGSVLGKRTLVDESSDSDFNPDPKTQKLMSASIAVAQSSQGVEDATFVASLIVTPPSSKDPPTVLTPVSPVIIPTPSPSVPQSSVGPSKPSDSDRITFLESQVLALQTQGESTSQSIEGNKDTSGVNEEEILLLEFFAESEEEEAEKIACLDDIDELFNDIEHDVSDNEIEEGEIFTYEGVTDSMDSFEDITLPKDTADSKIDTDDENIQSNKDAETDTTHIESPKVNEEPVMYRNIGMTREQWREVVNSWMKVLPKSQAQPAQKEKYVNKERCVGRIISCFYDNDTKLFAIKRSDGVKYLKSRIKYFNTLPRCEMNGLASKPLINRSKIGLANVIANLIKKEGGSGKYEKLKASKRKESEEHRSM
ncbi:hypothetical protein L1987_40389 [Smallanthus sonchifolius]|uniref:Uncharacterized protein n=1 Tax=Smallanthus sonchifolius TaxID=185202 RepID=A0ACB9GSI0_9ASTR|nr:hypothetical protein L1987_40389 [Smallanthus sonchifolius]